MSTPDILPGRVRCAHGVTSRYFPRQYSGALLLAVCGDCHAGDMPAHLSPIGPRWRMDVAIWHCELCGARRMAMVPANLARCNAPELAAP